MKVKFRLVSELGQVIYVRRRYLNETIEVTYDY